MDVPNIEPENRKLHPIETLGRQSKPTERQDRKTSEVKQTPLSSVKKVGEFIIPGVRVAFHVSPDKSGRLWVSDLSENLVQTDAMAKDPNQWRIWLSFSHTGREYDLCRQIQPSH